MFDGLGAWIGKLAIGALIDRLGAWLKSWIDGRKKYEQGRKDQADASLRQSVEHESEMNAAADDASKRHAADPSDRAFDATFERGDQ